MRFKPETRVQNGLAAWWPFDDGSGGDYSNNPSTRLTLNSSPIPAGGITTPANGPIRGGFSLNGSSSYLSSTDASLITLTGVSYTCWINATNFTPAYSGIIGRGANTVDQFINLFVKSTGKLACYAANSGANAWQRNYDGTGANTLVIAKWYHLAMCYDWTAGLFVYVNASLDKSVTANTGGLGDGKFSWSPNGTTAIGNDTLFAGRFFAGLVDDARCYNRILSAAEVLIIYSEGFRPSFAARRLFGGNKFVFRRTRSPLGTRTGSRQAA